ncbi:hypothetical protein ACFL1X_02520 [Candidatus Hydrogenedentota bacterium]
MRTTTRTMDSSGGLTASILTNRGARRRSAIIMHFESVETSEDRLKAYRKV